jgi:orotidine-5'-phosphate decarboxylase
VVVNAATGSGGGTATRPGIVALDRPGWRDAEQLVTRLGDAVSFYKVGLELFVSDGPAVVKELTARGKRVFLDLKLHDIPNTVAGAARLVVGRAVTASDDPLAAWEAFWAGAGA